MRQFEKYVMDTRPTRLTSVVYRIVPYRAYVKGFRGRARVATVNQDLATIWLDR